MNRKSLFIALAVGTALLAASAGVMASQRGGDDHNRPRSVDALVGRNVDVVFDNPKPADTINRTSNVRQGVTSENWVGGTLVSLSTGEQGFLVIDIDGTGSSSGGGHFGRMFIPFHRVVSITAR